MSFCCSLFQDSDLIITIKGDISDLHLFGYYRNLQLTVSFCHRLCNPIIHCMTQANLSILLYLLPFITTYTKKKTKKTTTQTNNCAKLRSTHPWHPHGAQLLISYVSLITQPQTLPAGVRQLLSLAANVTVTQVIGTLCFPFTLPTPTVRQRKFSQSSQYKMKPCLACQIPISSLPFQSSVFRESHGCCR